MLRETLAAATLLFLLSASLALAAPVSPSTGMVSWNASDASGRNVSLGSPIAVLVSGPPNGTFSVTLAGAPPLTTATVFCADDTLRNVSANATTGATELVRVPTGGLAYGPYTVSVSNVSLSFVFASFPVSLVLGVNQTQDTARYDYLWAQYNASLARQESQAGVIDAMLTQVNILYGVIEILAATVVGCIVSLVYVYYLKSRLDWLRNWWERRKLGWFDLWHRPANRDPYEHVRREAPRIAPDPAAVWVTKPGLYRDCHDCALPMRKEAKVAHLRLVHRNRAAEASVEMSRPQIEDVARTTVRAPAATRKAVARSIKESRRSDSRAYDPREMGAGE